MKQIDNGALDLIMPFSGAFVLSGTVGAVVGHTSFLILTGVGMLGIGFVLYNIFNSDSWRINGNLITIDRNRKMFTTSPNGWDGGWLNQEPVHRRYNRESFINALAGSRYNTSQQRRLLEIFDENIETYRERTGRNENRVNRNRRMLLEN